ncbi:MAG: hypothetical protein IT337_05720 [Thermomicrobiales bacterium]|nr:hypothetical protein [Thermomicrobiales bacterium]
MSMVGRAGEGLARTINRRTALKKAAAAVFGAVAAWSVEGVHRNSALADVCTYVTAGDCACNPPYGEFCSNLDPSYCSGSSCASGCSYDESWWYVGGCWCSATCAYTSESGQPLTGYYKCCDCNCYGAQCTCREFVPVSEAPPAPEPGPTVPTPGQRLPFPPGFPFND